MVKAADKGSGKHKKHRTKAHSSGGETSRQSASTSARKKKVVKKKKHGSEHNKSSGDRSSSSTRNKRKKKHDESDHSSASKRAKGAKQNGTKFTYSAKEDKTAGFNLTKVKGKETVSKVIFFVVDKKTLN